MSFGVLVLILCRKQNRKRKHKIIFGRKRKWPKPSQIVIFESAENVNKNENRSRSSPESSLSWSWRPGSKCMVRLSRWPGRARTSHGQLAELARSSVGPILAMNEDSVWSAMGERDPIQSQTAPSHVRTAHTQTHKTSRSASIRSQFSTGEKQHYTAIIWFNPFSTFANTEITGRYFRYIGIRNSQAGNDSNKRQSRPNLAKSRIALLVCIHQVAA